ncbi:hypothetical protein O7627_21250 [Solwaraspora sp. WMMD1047]|uniref:hypothetical protein n=1 Tax=Solwaraspora sp. WMMD1047 TaxID=3016102 RepID=UPI00241605C7|nr:hypothetical protein [Solwaraspora sp. WMMD1047]MDG4831810.1 hypothetical protein [Solwaraspora sp. WMMD1047]
MTGPPDDDQPEPDTPRAGWTAPPFPTGTLSGACLDSTSDAVPASVQADTFRMILARHEPASATHCVCGAALGEETGLCWYGRSAQRGLMALLAQ